MSADIVKKRRRGTAIVETDEGILVTAGRHGSFLLPGGEARRDETRTVAAARELHEETGLNPWSISYLFHHTGHIHWRHGFRDHHTVCLIKASGKAAPRREVKRVAFYRPGSKLQLSRDAGAIIKRYYQWKIRHSIV